jgi:platelet-activating factor acetylhydrolase IB subunit beta/gamma
MLCLRLPALALVAALPAAAAPACPAPSGREATVQPEVRRGHEVRFRERTEAISAALRRERYDVIMLGDSLVQQWPQAAAERAFPGRRVLNAGVSGDTTQALLHRLDGRRIAATVQGERVVIGVTGWERQRPAAVLILLGTNNLRDHPPCDIVAGLLAVVERTRRLWPDARILLLSLLPRGERQDDRQGEIAAVNAELAAIAARRAAPFTFLDVHGALLCPGGGPCGMSRPPNHVHLTEEGYARLAAAVRAAIERGSLL